MASERNVARALARAFLAGDWSKAGMTRRGEDLLGGWKWIRAVAKRVTARFTGKRPGWRELSEFIQPFLRPHGVAAMDLGGPMLPARNAPAAGKLPPLESASDLAFWLGLRVEELEWFADCRRGERRSPQGPLRHYRYRWIIKRKNNWRLLEIPKPRLKEIQRIVLKEILDRIPPHSAAHGFRVGRSVKTFAEPHAGQAVVARLDLRNFFPSVQVAKAFAMFRTVGYPEPVARLLTGLCVNEVPPDVWEGAPEGIRSLDSWHARRWESPHLPQGAPTSPALANLCVVSLDRRLAALANSLDATYTRYADDLAFSGGDALARAAGRVVKSVTTIARKEGFRIHAEKTRIMRRGGRQRLAGVVVNAHPNLPRDEYDRLKALLFNCVRRGPESQNRANHPDFRAFLAGKTAHAALLNEARARKLWTLFEQINWNKQI
ncbi:MAG: reverse transcriptase family protein [Planctomycetales bacterium]